MSFRKVSQSLFWSNHTDGNTLNSHFLCLQLFTSGHKFIWQDNRPGVTRGEGRARYGPNMDTASVCIHTSSHGRWSFPISPSLLCSSIIIHRVCWRCSLHELIPLRWSKPQLARSHVGRTQRAAQESQTPEGRSPVSSAWRHHQYPFYLK